MLWDITPKVPDKAEGAGGGDSATSSEFCDSLRAEKPVLADSGSQHIEEEVKQSSSLPALPRPLLNAIRYTHRPSTDSQRPGRVKTSAKSVSKARTRQNAYLILMWPLPPLSTPSKRLRHPMGGSWMMERGVVTTYMAVLPSQPPTRSCDTSGMLRILTGTRECLPDRYAVPTN